MSDISNRFRVRALCASFVAMMTLVAGAPADVHARQATARKIYVSVLDKAGAPVKDMAAADFEVKENGKVQTINVQPATAPLRVALIVADGGTGAYQGAAAAFMNALAGKAEFRVVGVQEQPEVFADYTSSVPDLNAAVQRLTRRAAGRMAPQVMEAITETSKTIGAPDKRSVIVLLRVGGEASSNAQANNVREALRKAGAKLYVVSPVGASGMAMMKSNNNENQERADQYAQLNLVLDDGSKETGGRHDQSAPAGMGKVLEQLAAELQNQYEVSYTLADGVKPSDKVQVTTKRKDVKVYAPSKIAN